MHSTLFKIGPLVIHAYGLMLALSFILGVQLVMRWVKRDGISEEKIVDLAFVVLFSAILGARIFYILSHLKEYAHDPLGVLRVWEGGLSMYGGVILSVIIGTWFLKKNRLPVWRMADYIALAMALGLFLTRIGCFLNGCCFGKPSSLPWAICFPSDSVAGIQFPGEKIHPTQIYESLLGLSLFFLLLIFHRFKRFDGFFFWLFILLYSLFRFFIDFIRFYEPSSILIIAGWKFTFSQITSVLLILFSLFMLENLRRRAKPKILYSDC